MPVGRQSSGRGSTVSTTPAWRDRRRSLLALLDEQVAASRASASVVACPDDGPLLRIAAAPSSRRRVRSAIDSLPWRWHELFPGRLTGGGETWIFEGGLHLVLSPAEREPAGVGLVDMDDRSRSAEPARRRGRVPRLLRRLPKITMCRFCEGTVLVGPGVFLPRAESEGLAVEGLGVLDDNSRRVVDVGCGSGAVAVTLAAARPRATVLATDVSAAALWWTLVNGWRRGRRMRVAKGTVLAPLPASWRGEVDLVVANVPSCARRSSTERATSERSGTSARIPTVSGCTGCSSRTPPPLCVTTVGCSSRQPRTACRR